MGRAEVHSNPSESEAGPIDEYQLAHWFMPRRAGYAHESKI
jgi:hypothetical protein